MSHVVNSGLSLTVPDNDETNWYVLMEAIWTAISAHTHDTANNRGAQIGTAGLANNSVNDAIMRLRNSSFFRSRNAADSGDVNLLRANSNDHLDLGVVLAYGNATTETLTGSGAISISVGRTILNGATLAMTLASGTSGGQLKFLVNINATAATVTFNTTWNAVMAQNSVLVLYLTNGVWQPVFANKVTLTESFSGAASWSGNSSHVRCTGTTYTVTTPNGNLGQSVLVENAASGNVTFGGQVLATGTYYLYSYLNSGWRRVALT